jgi:hypothetical protein
MRLLEEHEEKAHKIATPEIQSTIGTSKVARRGATRGDEARNPQYHDSDRHPTKPVWGYHGTRSEAILPICNNGNNQRRRHFPIFRIYVQLSSFPNLPLGLLRVGHPLNPSISTDEGEASSSI